MKHLSYVLQNEKEVLDFLKLHFPIYHESNVFFRDIQYGIQSLLERKGMRIGYTDGETVAREFIRSMEEKKIFMPVDKQTWVVNNPEYRKPQIKAPAASARPAPPKAAAAMPPAAAAAPEPAKG
jgi:hypothetical protein